MKTNMGTADRVIRVMIAITLAILCITGQVSGLGAIVLGIFAVVMLFTSTLGFCPLYVPFKISTHKNKKA